jgi:hypothetical protein
MNIKMLSTKWALYQNARPLSNNVTKGCEGNLDYIINYGMVWYSIVWYGMVLYGILWCGVVSCWCGVVWYYIILHCSVY